MSPDRRAPRGRAAGTPGARLPILALASGLGALALWRASEGEPRDPRPALRQAPVPEERVPPRSPRARPVRLARALREIEASRSGERSAERARARLAAAACYRAAGAFGLARAHLRPVAEEGPRDLRARAMLELAHLARRDGWVDQARARYARLAFREGGLDRSGREEALRLWASMEAERGDPLQAERLWVLLGVESTTALDRVRAWERVVRSRVRSGHGSAAFWIVYACFGLHAEHARERTRSGERVRDALLRLASQLG